MPEGYDPAERILCEVHKVRGWANDLRSGRVVGLKVIAIREDVSVARVSQLLPLAQLSTEQLAACLKSLRRVSLRALIRVVRASKFYA